MRVGALAGLLVLGLSTPGALAGSSVPFVYLPQERVIYFGDGYHGGVLFPGAADAAASLEEILALLERAPLYRVTLELEGALWEELLGDPQYAGIIDRLRQRIAEGRIELVGGTYSQPFFYLNDGEGIIRQFTIGLAIVERGFGFRHVTYTAQEPGFTAQLPQVLDGFGFRFVKLTNRWMAFGSPPTFDEPFFLWRGPDGSTILTSPRYGCQAEVDFWATPVFGSKSLDLFPDRPLLDGCYRSGVTVPFTLTLEDLLANNLIPWSGTALLRRPPIHVRWATPRAYFEEALRQRAEAEPVALAVRTIAADRVVDNPWEGAPDDALPFPWGIAGGEVQRAARAMERGVLETERWAALASFATPAPYPDAQLDALWRDTLWAQNHDVWVVLPPAFLSSDVEPRVLNGAETLTREALGALAAAVDTERAAPMRESEPIVVFNSTSRAVRDIVAVDLGHVVDDARRLSVTNERGEAVPFQVVTGTSVLMAAEVPMLGYRTYFVGETAAAVPRSVMANGSVATVVGSVARLESDLYAAEFDLDHGGALVRLFDKDLGVNLVSRAFPAHVISGFFSETAQFARSDDAGPVRAEVVESGPLRAIIRFEHTGYPLPLQSTVTLTAGVKRLDVELEADFGSGVRVGNQAYGPESWRVNRDKLNVRLPLPAADSVLRDGPFHVEPTDRASFSANRFAAVAAPSHYVAVLLDRPAALVRSENALALVLAYGGDYIYPPAQLAGNKRFAYALTSGADPWADGGLQARADQWDYRLRAIRTAHHPGTLPPGGSLVDVSGEVTVSAILLADGQPRLRLFNPSPFPRAANLRLSTGPPLSKLLDLRGRVLGDAQLPLPVPPFGLVTLGPADIPTPQEPPEMPAAPVGQIRQLPARSTPRRARFYLKPGLALGNREPPIPRPARERMRPGAESSFVTAPLPASLTLAGPARATLFLASRSSSPPQVSARVRVRIETLDTNRPLAEGEAVADLTRCEPRLETFLTPLCAVPVKVTLPFVPATPVAAGERLVARISFEVNGPAPPLYLLYDSTHYPSRLELPVEDLLAVAAVRGSVRGDGPQAVRVEVEVEDRLGSGDLLDAAAVLRWGTGSRQRVVIPLGFERDLTPTRSLWIGAHTTTRPAAEMNLIAIARNLARTTALGRGNLHVP